MRFSDDFINRVRESNNLVDIISQFTELKRTGSNLMGRCPFPDHREKTPSFSVSENKQVFYCFGCKKSGDIFKFLEFMRGQSFPEAVEALADRAGIAMPAASHENQDESHKARDQRKKLLAVNKYAGAFFRQQLQALPQQHPVREYMLSRGLTPEVCEEFKIGYAPTDRQLLVDYLIAKRVPLDLAEQLGLVRRSTQGHHSHYSLFRERIMFPIIGISDEVLGFGGRAMGEEMPKYINSQASPLFDKSRTLYGLNLTARHIRADDEAIVVEGYMDVIGLYVAGIKNVAAPLGTALTADHAKVLSRMSKHIVVLFDGDSAGQSAAERSLPILLEAGLLARGLTLPGTLDPDEAVEELGVDHIRALVSKAEDLMTWYLKRLFKGFQGQPTEKVQIMETVGPLLLRTKDPKLLDLYTEQLAGLLRVEMSWLTTALTQLAKKIGVTYQPPALARPRQLPWKANSAPSGRKVDDLGITKDERLLLGLALSKSNFLDRILSEEITQYLGQTKFAEIFANIEKLYRHQNQPFDRLVVLLSDQISEPRLLSVLTEHLEKGFAEMVETGGDKAVLDAIDRIKAKYYKEESEKLAEQLKTDNDPQTLERFMNIQRARHSLRNS